MNPIVVAFLFFLLVHFPIYTNGFELEMRSNNDSSLKPTATIPLPELERRSDFEVRSDNDSSTPQATCICTLKNKKNGISVDTYHVYDINGWAGSGGKYLKKQENGCGMLYDFEIEDQKEGKFKNEDDHEKMDKLTHASFKLSWNKSGCVERAIHSAGGPPAKKVKCNTGKAEVISFGAGHENSVQQFDDTESGQTQNGPQQQAPQNMDIKTLQGLINYAVQLNNSFHAPPNPPPPVGNLTDIDNDETDIHALGDMAIIKNPDMVKEVVGSIPMLTQLYNDALRQGKSSVS